MRALYVSVYTHIAYVLIFEFELVLKDVVQCSLSNGRGICAQRLQASNARCVATNEQQRLAACHNDTRCLAGGSSQYVTAMIQAESSGRRSAEIVPLPSSTQWGSQPHDHCASR